MGKKNGVATPRWTDEEKLLLRDLVDRGASRLEIGLAFPNRTYDAVRTRAREMGIPIGQYKSSGLRVQTAFALPADTHFQIKELSRTYGEPMARVVEYAVYALYETVTRERGDNVADAAE